MRSRALSPICLPWQRFLNAPTDSFRSALNANYGRCRRILQWTVGSLATLYLHVNRFMP